MRRPDLILVGVVLVSITSHSALAGPELTTNGGFLDAVATGDGLGGFFGWTLSDPAQVGVTVVSTDTSGLSGFSGAAFGPLAPFTVGQSIATVVGATYQFSFNLQHSDVLSNNPAFCATPCPDNSFSAAFGTSTVTSLTNVGDQSSFQGFTFSEIATGSTTNISFDFFDPPDLWYLDSVSVTETAPPAGTVPEPPVWTMLIVGLAMLTRAALKRPGGAAARLSMIFNPAR